MLRACTVEELACSKAMVLPRCNRCSTIIYGVGYLSERDEILSFYSEKWKEAVKKLQKVETKLALVQEWDEDMFVAPHADVWFNTARVDGLFRPIGAHRCVLASKSPVFKAMFFNEMKEKETGLVEIAEISYEVLKALIKFTYTGDVEEDLLAVQVQPLLEAAVKYDMKSLQSFCIVYIIENVVPSPPFEEGELDTLTYLFQLALTHGLKDLTKGLVKQMVGCDPAACNQNLQLLVGCASFRALREADPSQALEICECILHQLQATESP